MTKLGWGAVVLGGSTDLEDWAYVLKEPFDPWVEIHGSETVLRSASLDELDSASEVHDRCIAYIDRLNGAIALSQDARPLRFGGVIKFAPNGRLHRTVFAEAALFEIRAKLRATATVRGPDGQPIPPTSPQPSEVQNWAMLVEKEALLEDALTYFGKATDWFDIYKALECVILRFGPSEAEFLALNWAPSDEVQRLKRTANWARHAKRKFAPPPRPMELREARGVLGQLLRRAFLEAGRGGRGGE